MEAEAKWKDPQWCCNSFMMQRMQDMCTQHGSQPCSPGSQQTVDFIP